MKKIILRSVKKMLKAAKKLRPKKSEPKAAVSTREDAAAVSAATEDLLNAKKSLHRSRLPNLSRRKNHGGKSL